MNKPMNLFYQVLSDKGELVFEGENQYDAHQELLEFTAANPGGGAKMIVKNCDEKTEWLCFHVVGLEIAETTEKRKFTVHWSKAYFASGMETIEAESEEEADVIADEQIGNWQGSIQYYPDQNIIHIDPEAK